MTDPLPTKTIHVVSCDAARSGTSASGKPWTLYDVVAVDMDGAPIEEKLKSFDKLEGQVTVEVETQVHEKYGTSYMLKLPHGQGGAEKPAGARLGPKVDELRARVEAAERQLSELTPLVEELRRVVAQLAAATVRAAATARPGAPDVARTPALELPAQRPSPPHVTPPQPARVDDHTF